MNTVTAQRPRERTLPSLTRTGLRFRRLSLSFRPARENLTSGFTHWRCRCRWGLGRLLRCDGGALPGHSF
eukprot:6560144-Prymnesium_polylepis.1